MSQPSQPKQSDLVKVLERQNVISYKKKPKLIKQILRSQNNNQDQDNISAQSLQSGVYSEDVSRMKNKMNPLPELGKQKKRFISKNLLTQELRINNYQEKEVRQHDNLMLKQKNNFLSSENMKLKTKISTLEKQNLKLQKMLDEQPTKAKTPGLTNLTRERFKPSGQNISAKIVMKNLKKQLQDLKKQNISIKSSIKFTTIAQLECQRDAIMQQTNRLRIMLEQQQSKRISFKIKQHGMSNMQQRLSSLQQKNGVLTRQNNQLKNRLKSNEQNHNKIGKSAESQKNLNKMLYNVRRLLKQKQKEVQLLRQQIKTTGSIQSIGLNSDKSITGSQLNNQINIQQQNQRKPSVQKSNPATRNFQKRIVSKSAQKSNTRISQKSISDIKCQNCKKLRSEIQLLKKKISDYQTEFQISNPLVLPSDPVDRPKDEQIQSLIRFVEFRFKAHHLTLAQSQKYLLNSENINDQQLKKQVTVQNFLQSVVTQPFVILNKRYIEVFLIEVCFTEQSKKGSDKIKIDKTAKITKKKILQNYRKLMPTYELLPQSKEQEMFLQIAELVTSYYQQILAAMSNRKNGQGTISQKDMTQFFTQIQLQKQYIDFIITQIILESIDLDRLNYFAFFEIFYMPQQEGQGASQEGQAAKKLGSGQAGLIDKKKRFEVDHVVKQQDEEYEQSRSYVDASRQKTLSKHGQSQSDSHNQLYEDDGSSPSKAQSPNKNDVQKQQNYEQEEQQYGYDEQQQQMQQVPKSTKKVQKVDQIPKNTVIKTHNKSQKPKQKKKAQRDDSYAQQFQQQKMNSQIEQQHQTSKQKKVQPVQKLIQKPYQIEDIQDQYNEEFDN